MGECSLSNPKSRFAEIIVVRHGETAWNACGRIQGHLDVELNDVGRKQARAIADHVYKEYKFDAVYSSDLKRASETAQEIANKYSSLHVTLDPMLRERHLGDLQGLVYSEAAKLKPKVYEAFISSSSEQEIPGGGESRDQFYQRCVSSLEQIAQKHIGERILVATHGGFVRSLYRRATGRSPSQRKVMNASINIFHVYENGNWFLKTWGDVSHLAQSGFLENAFGGDQNSG